MAKWVVIEESGAMRTDRLRVPGGWLVRTRATIQTGQGVSVAVSQTFIPTPAADQKITLEWLTGVTDGPQG